MSKVHQIVIDKIIKKLEEGVIPWHCPWEYGLPKNLVSKKSYSGINLILLGMLPFQYPLYLTRNQVYKRDGSIKHGERSNLIVYYKPFNKRVEKIDEVTHERYFENEKKFILRYYSVYNIEQTSLPIPEFKKHDKIEACEKIIDSMPLKPIIIHKYQKAYYSPTKDMVNIPSYESFKEPELYYNTLFHELIHSTGHQTRLDRDSISKEHAFGDTVYSKEELIAELGSAFLCANAGISAQTLNDSSAYLNGWLNVLRKRPQYLFSCSSKAKKASDFILHEG
jgi:antirestriction protein ArdC